MIHPEGRILVFTRAPVPGRVKTRLAPALGPRGCARLQRRLLLHTLATATRANLAEVELWCSPDAGHGFLAGCARRFGVRLKTQQGDHLGARMQHALAASAADRRFTLLIGCDCPARTEHHLAQACRALNTDCSVVLQPAEDGGYTLVGTRGQPPEIFSGVDWGTARVMTQTRNRLRALEHNWRELTTLWDIDTPADLQRLARSPWAGLIR